MKLPRAIRFFRKPDHISFLIGFSLLWVILSNNIFEIKIMSFVGFSFTLAYELLEISKGGREIYKIDHFTFIIGYALMIYSFIDNNSLILPIVLALMSFTLAYEVYRVRKLDLKNMKKK